MGNAKPEQEGAIHILKGCNNSQIGLDSIISWPNCLKNFQLQYIAREFTAREARGTAIIPRPY
jgi:hypothetical protein